MPARRCFIEPSCHPASWFACDGPGLYLWSVHDHNSAPFTLKMVLIWMRNYTVPSFKAHNNPMGLVLLWAPFYRRGKQGIKT